MGDNPIDFLVNGSAASVYVKMTIDAINVGVTLKPPVKVGAAFVFSPLLLWVLFIYDQIDMSLARNQAALILGSIVCVALAVGATELQNHSRKRMTDRQEHS